MTKQTDYMPLKKKDIRGKYDLKIDMRKLKGSTPMTKQTSTWQERFRELELCKCKHGKFCGDTQFILETFIATELDAVRKDEHEKTLRLSSPNRQLYQLGLKDGAKKEREKILALLVDENEIPNSTVMFNENYVIGGRNILRAELRKQIEKMGEV